MPVLASCAMNMPSHIRIVATLCACRIKVNNKATVHDAKKGIMAHTHKITSPYQILPTYVVGLQPLFV